jgi:hypothetical protein
MHAARMPRTSTPDRFRAAISSQAPWTVQEDAANVEHVWAALDCPGAYAVLRNGRGLLVLGRLAVRVERTPVVGERCVAVGWALGSEGRRHGAGTALFTAGGELLATGRALWIEPHGL